MSTDDYLAALGITQFVRAELTEPLVESVAFSGYCYRLTSPEATRGYLVASAPDADPAESALLLKLIGALGCVGEGDFQVDVETTLAAGPSEMAFLILLGELPALPIEAPIIIRSHAVADLLARPDLKRPLWQALKTQLPFLAPA